MNKETDKVILIVEEDRYFQEELKKHLNKIGFDNLLITNNYEEAQRLFKTNCPDVALINVKIGEKKSGIDLAKEFNHCHLIPIVFITLNNNLKVYETAKKVRPIAFVTKKVSMFKLKQIIELGLMNSQKKLVTPIHYNAEPVQEDIFIKIGNVLKKYLFKEIDWFGVDGKFAYAKIGKKKLLLNVSLKELEEKISQQQFIRVHQSYMVNIKKIESVNPIKNITVINQVEIPIGRSYKKELINRINYF